MSRAGVSSSSTGVPTGLNVGRSMYVSIRESDAASVLIERQNITMAVWRPRMGKVRLEINNRRDNIDMNSKPTRGYDIESLAGPKSARNHIFDGDQCDL